MISALLVLLAFPFQTSDPTVPATAKSMYVTEGKGVQIYTCTQAKWGTAVPEAKLYDHDKQVGTHSAGPTWTWSDGSAIYGTVLQRLPSATSIPGLLLSTKPVSPTPGALTPVVYVRRSDTKGGLAPTGACTEGQSERVPYTATYTFYTANPTP